MVATHCALGLAIAFAATDRFALVVAMFTAREGEFHLGPPLHEVEAQRYQRQTLFGNASIEALDLVAMQEEFSATLRIGGIRTRRRFIGRDVKLLEPEFAAMHHREGVAEIGSAITEALHLGPDQDDASLERIDDFVLETTASIRRDDVFPIGVDRLLLFLAALRHGGASVAESPLEWTRGLVSKAILAIGEDASRVVTTRLFVVRVRPARDEDEIARLPSGVFF
jgi:hypothetical protein